VSSRSDERVDRKGALLRLRSRRGRVLAPSLLAAGCLCVAVGGASAASSRAAAGLTIFAGSSMTSVLPEIDPGNTYSFGSTGTLAAQISNGAPADVLMGANTTTCASLYASGVAEKPVDFTRNTLEVVVPKSNPAGITSIYDLTKPGITVDEAASTVPVGSYTVQVLNQMGLNSAVQANVVSQETSDANVVAKVALGQVDAGFVYLSDYVINPTQLALIRVPAWAQPKITYAMCVITKSPNQAAAQAWVAKITGPVGQAVFVRDGFLPLTAPVPTISRVNPRSAAVGATVTIRGTNLTGTTSVTFQGVPSKFKVVSPYKITLTIPSKAKTGTLTVTNPSGTATWNRFAIT
jgi:molybdate transport system substrate-binding protein